MLETVRQLTSEIKLKQAIIEGFIPSQEQQIIYDCADYDASAEKWKIAHVQSAGNNVKDGGRKSHETDIHEIPFSKDGDLEWDSMIAFQTPYLSYEVPGLRSKKVAIDKLNLTSRKTKGNQSGISESSSAPVARGLIAKKKHYA